MLFSQTVLILGAFLATNTLGLALEPRDGPMHAHESHPSTMGGKMGGGYKFCYQVQVKAILGSGYKPSSQDLTHHIKHTFTLPDPSNSKDCGKENVNLANNPPSGNVLKAFKTQQAPNYRHCHMPDKMGCGLTTESTLSERSAMSCGTCGKLA
ncbi:hypothetical protein Vi05172_g12831 [Venturia inaequalis]|nr:hypothetical protein Vi05172_g12831 [Venturia inaequalis]